MKPMNIATLCVVFIVVTAAQCVTHTTRPATEQGSSPLLFAACDSEVDLSKEIKVLSTGDWAEVDTAKDLLLKRASRSNQCRTEVISHVMSSMNKSDLDFVADRSSYFLWLNGSILLGRLKAVEALDLLIDHLDLNDGQFSASMTHQPAVLGVTAMGSSALPKLTTALKVSQNRNIRLAAGLCINEIGGPSVLSIMTDALRSEQDACVRHLLEMSVEMSKLGGVPESSRSNEQEMALTELRRRLLYAMRCRN